MRLVHVDFVCMDGGWKVTEALLENFDLKPRIGFLVVGIPAQMVNESMSLIDACSDLGAELRLGLGLSPDYSQR